jgi:hypothetical protein
METTRSAHSSPFYTYANNAIAYSDKIPPDYDRGGLRKRPIMLSYMFRYPSFWQWLDKIPIGNGEWDFIYRQNEKQQLQPVQLHCLRTTDKTLTIKLFTLFGNMRHLICSIDGFTLRFEKLIDGSQRKLDTFMKLDITSSMEYIFSDWASSVKPVFSDEICEKRF